MKKQTRAKARPDDEFDVGAVSVNGNSSILKGSMLNPETKFVCLKIRDVRKPPPRYGWCVFLLDFTPTPKTAEKFRGTAAEKTTSWGLNASNYGLLRPFVAENVRRELVGASICLKVVRAFNPTLEEYVPSFEIWSVRMPGEAEYVRPEDAEDREVEDEPEEMF